MKRPATAALLVLACSCAGPTRPAEPRPERNPVETYRAFGRMLDPSRSKASTAAAVVPGTLSAEERAAQAGERKAAEDLARDLDPARTSFDGRVERLAHAYWLGRSGRLEGEREVLQKLCEDEPAFYPARLELGRTWFLLSETGKAVTELQEARKLTGPDDEVDFELAQARILGEGDGLEEGLATMERFVDDEELGNLAVRVLAEGRMRRFEPEVAEALLRERIRTLGDATPSSMRLALARSRFAQGGYQDAALMLQPLCAEAWPQQGDALLLQFQTLRALGLFDEAGRQLERFAGPGFAREQRRAGFDADRFARAREDLELEKKAGRRVTYYSEVELAADLVHNPDAAHRRRLAKVIVGSSVSSKERLLEVAFAKDPDPANRNELLVELLRMRGPTHRATLLAAVADASPEVRRTAYPLLARLEPAEDACAELWKALRDEDDPSLFRRLHESLQKVSGKDRYLAPGDERDAAVRERLRVFWAEQLQITTGAAGEGDGR